MILDHVAFVLSSSRHRLIHPAYRLRGFVAFFRAIFLSMLACLTGCIHDPVPRIAPIIFHLESVSDASDHSDNAEDSAYRFWMDLRLEYYRSGEMIHVEWGKIFTADDGCGRILIDSPDRNYVDRRSFGFERAELNPKKSKSMHALLHPVLLPGWIIGDIQTNRDGLLIVRAFPAVLDGREYFTVEEDPEMMFCLAQFWITMMQILIEASQD